MMKALYTQLNVLWLILRALVAATILSASGLAVSVAASTPTVPIDQQPLIVAKPLAPNIVLMLDDSRSMTWDYMPDSSYIKPYTLDSFRNSSINFVYYDPNTTYEVPVSADGTPYPNASFPNAWINGFDSSAGSTDIRSYESPNIGGFVYYTQLETSAGKKNYFTYTSSSGALHYVAKTGDCGIISSSTDRGNCTDSAAAQQNVANWFAYYHTRILMAKSGLTLAFAGLDKTYRFGFASINGRNTADIPSPQYSFSTSNNSDNKLAEVQPFGDGKSTDQKTKFWDWLTTISPNYGTPLRDALKAVGEYYKTAQPWETSSTDTTEYACRPSYTILTTDGFWNGDDPGVGNVDGTDGSKITGPDNQSYTYTKADPYKDSYSSTLADVAMKYWSTDLRPTLPNEVPKSTEDPAFWQHMTTFTIGLGFMPTGISPAGTSVEQIFSWANGGTAISGFSWPEPAPNSINNIADLAHAAVNGHGGFYSATSPQAFTNGLSDALKRVSERVGTGASLAANSTKLDLGTVTYQASYYTGKWKGDLKALAVDPNTGAISATPTWTAASALPAATDRNIWTYNPDGKNAASQYVAFKNTSSSNPPALSTNELTALGSDAATQATIVDYLRGDPTYENSGTLRKRDTPLGDIVDSQPLYVGAPNPDLFINQTFTGADKYAAFASTEQSRTATIYVAANDGMLHAFDASNGKEVYAYLPAAVITNGLATLANKNYGASSAYPHQFFNDGEMTIADIYAGNAWKTILVGTTGRGEAKAVYALDVTDPTSIQFLWERSAGDGLSNAGAIGQMTGKPVIAQTADKHWQVLMGNGYNSADDKAELLAFNLTKTNGQIDTSGALTVYSTDSATSNGLAAPGVWIDNASNGLSTEAYAGDLLGRVWKFDLTNPGSAGQLLFTAKDSGGTAQPITAGLLLGKDPITNNVWAFFGTGKYLSGTDLTDMNTQTWYGIIVAAGTGQPSSLVSNLVNGRSALVQRSIVAEVSATSGDSSATPPVLPSLGKRAFTPKPSSNDMTGKSGWYIDLTSPVNGAEGERMVTPNQFQGSLLLGTSRIPQASDVCNPSGRGWIMVIDPFTGTNPSSTFFDTNGDGKFDTADLITLPDGTTLPAGGVGFSSLPNNPIFTGNTMLVSFDNGTTSSINTQGSVGSMKRVSWREIVNQ
jgi:type IV pilus assembly protein PilY1